MAEQLSLPLGFVRGEPLFEQPTDLYIPPEALHIFLDAFSGPMDLLLYLIRKHQLNILELPILPVIEQYLDYVDMMHELQLELAADYLVMAAMLTEIKSRMLLPRQPDAEEEEDPRAELMRRLQEYEVARELAQQLDGQPQEERDYAVAHVHLDLAEGQAPLPSVSLSELAMALTKVYQLLDAQQHHQITREVLSTRERMSDILSLLEPGKRYPFVHLFDKEQGKAGVVVSFLAILELCKEKWITLVQASEFSDIYVMKAE